MHGGLGLDFVYLFRLNIICCYVSLDKSIPLLLVFCCVGFSFFSTKPRDWWEERLQNDLFCV